MCVNHQVAWGRAKSRANPNENECAEKKENEKRDAKDTSKRFLASFGILYKNFCLKIIQ